jgi:hypothetical protein
VILATQLDVRRRAVTFPERSPRTVARVHRAWPAGGLDFKGGIALIDVGYRYAAEELSKSGLAKQFMT